MEKWKGIHATNEIIGGSGGNGSNGKESSVAADGRTHNTTRIEVSKAKVNRELSGEKYIDKIEDELLRGIVKGMTIDKKQKLFAALAPFEVLEEKRLPLLEAGIKNNEDLFAWVNYYANETDAAKLDEALTAITDHLQGVGAYQEAA